MDEVVIVGGGPTALAAGTLLAKARRNPVIVGAGGGPTAEAAARLRRVLGSLEEYGASVHDGFVRKGSRQSDSFRLTLDDGTTFSARTVLIATGVREDFPDIPGLATAWGSGASSCPYCTGWEVRDRPVVVLGEGTRAIRLAMQLTQWTDDVVLCTNGAAPPPATTSDALRAGGVRVLAEEMTSVRLESGRVAAVELTSGELPVAGVFVATTLRQHSMLAADLGCQLAPHAEVPDGVVVTDAEGRTTVPGVYAAGRGVRPEFREAAAAGAGNRAAIALNEDLLWSTVDPDLAAALA
jgi:thioredoxin reductase